MDDSQPIKKPSPDRERLWGEIWARHAMFEEDPISIQQHFATQGVEVSVGEVRDAIEWSADQAEAILTRRRGLRARAAVWLAARRKLVWNEIRRLQRDLQQHGGFQETTRYYGPDGKLERTKVKTRSVTRDLMSAERALAELDRFSATIDGIGNPEEDDGRPDYIQIDLTSIYDRADEPTEGGSAPPSLEGPREAPDPPRGPDGCELDDDEDESRE